MMPPAAQFAEAMSRYGVGDGVRVVLYDRAVNMWAARVWWMLRAFGFDEAAVLDGGFKKWTREGRPLARDDGASARRPFMARPRPAVIADKAGVLAALGDEGTCVLNALSDEQHRGAGGVTYARPGHIRGSANVAARDLVDPETHAYLPLDVLRAKFAGAGRSTPAASSPTAAPASPRPATPSSWRSSGAPTSPSTMPRSRSGPPIPPCRWRPADDCHARR